MLTMIIVALITAMLFGFCIAPVNGRRRRNRAVGFFHPYTNDGGGGERVLWCAVRGIQEEIPDLDCYIYTGDHDATPQSLMARALDRFGVTLLSPPKVVHLYKRNWIEETTYPHFAMIGQSLLLYITLTQVDMLLHIHLPGCLDVKLFAIHLILQSVQTCHLVFVSAA
ncbi:hypothetical protein PHAVU_010G113266 [Phaseolus vulgaris]